MLKTDILSQVPISQQVIAPYLGTSMWRGSIVDQALLVCAGFHLASLRRSQSQLDTLLAALLSACTELCLVLSFMIKPLKVFHTD